MKLVIKNIFNNSVSGSTDLFQKISYLIIAVIVASILFSLIQKNFIFNIEITDLHKYNSSDFEIVDNQAANTVANFYKKPLEKSNLTHSFLSNEMKLEYFKLVKSIPNITLSKLPVELKETSSVNDKKELFIKIALPLIISENEILKSQNQKIKQLKNNFKYISKNDALWLIDKMKSYKVKNKSIDQLLVKVDIIPVSLALSQAAIESGWGTSRFAFEGNALFGQYVWGNDENGIVPTERKNNEAFSIKAFSSLRESVASYMLNLNSNHHYNEFRNNRFILKNSERNISGIHLAKFLKNYSIEDNYSSKVIGVIKTNDLEDLDDMKIDKRIIATNILSDII